MHDFLAQTWGELMARGSGPLWFRLILQPAMAAFLAIRAGLKDAKQGQPVFLWAVLSDPAERRNLLREGWKDVAKLFVVACVLDIVYQVLVLHAFRPVQTLLVATTLAIIPYLLIRGPVNRIARPRQPAE